jgi:hypothetical protein
MGLRQRLAVLAVAAVATVLLPGGTGSSIATPAAAGESCKRAVSAEGRMVRGERNARASAVAAWQSKAARQYGRPFASYNYSGDRSFTCRWDDRGVNYQCRVTALPCGPR